MTDEIDRIAAGPRYVLVNPALIEMLRGPYYKTVNLAVSEWWQDWSHKIDRNRLQENSRGD